MFKHHPGVSVGRPASHLSRSPDKMFNVARIRKSSENVGGLDPEELEREIRASYDHGSAMENASAVRPHPPNVKRFAPTAALRTCIAARIESDFTPLACVCRAWAMGFCAFRIPLTCPASQPLSALSARFPPVSRPEAQPTPPARPLRAQPPSGRAAECP